MSPRLELRRSSQVNSDKRRSGHDGKLVPFALPFTLVDGSRIRFHDRPRFAMILIAGAGVLAGFAMLIPLIHLVIEGQRKIFFEEQLLFLVGLFSALLIGDYLLWYAKTGRWVVLESGEPKAAVFRPGNPMDPKAIGEAMKPITVELWTCSVFGYYKIFSVRIRGSSKTNYHAVVIKHPDRIVVVCALKDRALAEDCGNRLAARCGTELYVYPYHQEIWGRELFGFNADSAEMVNLRSL